MPAFTLTKHFTALTVILVASLALPACNKEASQASDGKLIVKIGHAGPLTGAQMDCRS